MYTSRPYQKPKTDQVSSGTILNDNAFAEKSKCNNIVKNIRTHLMYFLNTSSIHGVNYIGETGRNLIERLVWSCVVVTVCSLCIMLINQTYDKWKTSPVIVTLENKETPIFEIPFPAVTICPEAKIHLKYFNTSNYITKRFHSRNVTEEENKSFKVLSVFCSSLSAIAESLGITVNQNFTGFEIFDEVLNYIPTSFFQNITKIQFLGKKADSDISRIITQEGLCYTFNMLPYSDIVKYADYIPNPNITVKEWSWEEGYSIEDTIDSYPRRTFLSGFDGGLEINRLYANHNEIDYLCEDATQGFKIALHHPCELPDMDKYFRLPLNQAVFVAIKPTMIRVSKELTHYKPEDRQCYFANEKFLSRYKIYTQHNCLVECLTNYTLEHCGCAPFWLKLPDTPICNSDKNACIKEGKINYLRLTKNLKLGQCNCLPLCTSLSYDIETSYTNWNWREIHKFYSSLNVNLPKFDPETAHLSKLIVYYKDMQFLTSKRHELYGIIDFLSNVGGLLGLFIGFSVISAVEIVYFLTLRIICNIKKYGCEYWAGEPRFVDNN